MSTTDVTKLQEMATKHLWLHFTAMQDLPPERLQIITHGEGPYVFDQSGRRVLDFLSGLFTVQIGYSHGEELGEAMLEQAKELPYYTNWTYAHPRSIELAAKLAELTPDADPALVLRLQRLRGGRVGHQAGSRLPRRQRPADAPQGDRAQARVPRHHVRRPVADRHHGHPHAVRAADAGRPARREHERVPLQVLRRSGRLHAAVRRRGGRDDRVRGSGDGLDGDHGAGAELRRVVHAASRLPPAGRRDLPRVRRPARRRRGDLRVRPARRVVRVDQVRLPARHHHGRQGAHQRVRADGRGDVHRPRGRGADRERPHVPARLDVRRPSGRGRGGAQEPRDHGARGRRRQRAAQRAVPRGAAARADGAARDHRRRPRRGLLLGLRAGQGPRHEGDVLVRGVATRCCATSCRPSCSRPACCAAPTTAATRSCRCRRR